MRGATSSKKVNFTFSDPRADPRFCILSLKIIQKYPKNEDLDEDPHEDLFFWKIMDTLLDTYNTTLQRAPQQK